MKKAAYLFLLLLTNWSVQAQTKQVRLAFGSVLTLERAPFRVTGNVLKYDVPKHANEFKSLISINGKPVMGTDGEIPKYVLAKATLLLNGHRYNLPVADMYNPWFGAGAAYGPNPELFRLLKVGPAYKLQALFSDGAGSYGAEWRLANNTAKRTLLTKDEDGLTNLFESEKQPQKYR